MTGTIMINSLIALIALHRCTKGERCKRLHARLRRPSMNAGAVDFAEAQRLKELKDKKRKGKGALPKAMDKDASFPLRKNSQVDVECRTKSQNS
ncbi:hypothetical protein F5141DRAFT_1135720 [Pisolithus sp. B1]|nr:hypothetical protein F5141DRAFT_1135720 [Pisolithus sp. B1]